MIYFFIGWLVYFVIGLIWLIYQERIVGDITIEDFIAMALASAILGPLIPLRLWMMNFDYDLSMKLRQAMKIVIFKKCTKREVWEALGGKE